MPALDNPKHERFAQELAKGKTADEAYEIAGYKPDRGNASRLTANDNIKARVDEILERAATRVEINKAWVLERLVLNVDRAMQVEEIKDKDGGTGEFKYEGSVANRSLELIGKEIGMFKDKIEHSGPDGGPIEVTSDKDRARALAAFVAKTKAKQD
jgi:phage terminase small subunit